MKIFHLFKPFQNKTVCISPNVNIDTAAQYSIFIIRLSNIKKFNNIYTRLLGEISITSDMQMTPPSWQKASKN